MSNTSYKCCLCPNFQSFILRYLISHYHIVHSNEVNFSVICNVDGCPAKFTKYNSLYKHVRRHHDDQYCKTSYEKFRESKLNNCTPENRSNIDVSLEREEEISENDDNTDSELEQEGQSDNYVESNLDLEQIGLFNHDNENSSNPSEENSSDDENLNNGESSDEGDSTDEGASSDEDGFDVPRQYENQLERDAASFILRIKEKNNLSQVALDDIIENVRCLISKCFNNLQNDVRMSLQNCRNNHEDTLELFETIVDPFALLSSSALQQSYIKKNFRHVNPLEINLGSVLVRKKKGCKRILAEKQDTFVYIPIIESLEQLLSNPEIAKMVLQQPECSRENVYYDICDGSIYKNDDYFRSKPDALMIILYHDEVEVCNPLGSHATVHKLDMYYYTLGNLSPKFRSKHSAVRLVSIVKSDYVKKYGIEKVLCPIISDMEKPFNGWEVELGHTAKTIFAKLVMCTGDTLGQHLWAGMKEGVGVAFQKCRSCYCTFDDIQTKFDEAEFNLRTKELYDMHCDEIEAADNNAMRKNLQTTYGINKRSSLSLIPYFDITKQLPQDIMHTLLEGTVQYELLLVLNSFVQSGVFTLEKLNGSISSHDYGYTEISSKPIPLRETVFNGTEKYKLKYNASQCKNFLKLFPFIVGPLVDINDERYVFIVELIAITALVFTPVITDGGIALLKEKIIDHLAKFKELFPNKNLLPKHHYLIHIPNMIKQMGPMCRSACFAFEATHNHFKNLARKQNFKNLSLSMAKRHQFYETCNFGNSDTNPLGHPIFKTEKQFGVLRRATDIECVSLREQFDLDGLLPSISLNHVFKASWVVRYGTKYRKNDIVIIDVARNGLPKFGSIKQIWIIHDFIYFQYINYFTLDFKYSHQSYLVEKLDECACSAFESLVDYNVYYSKSVDRQLYIPIKYNLDYIMSEHVLGSNPLNLLQK